MHSSKCHILLFCKLSNEVKPQIDIPPLTSMGTQPTFLQYYRCNVGWCGNQGFNCSYCLAFEKYVYTQYTTARTKTYLKMYSTYDEHTVNKCRPMYDLVLYWFYLNKYMYVYIYNIYITENVQSDNEHFLASKVK